MEKLGAILRKALVHDRGQHFGAAEPAAQADQLRELFIVHFVHRLLDAVLRAIEFLANADPIALVGRFGDGLGVRRNRIAHANALGEREDALANLLHRGRIFRLHRDEAIGDHRAEQKGDARTFGEIASLFVPDVFAPVHPAQLVQCAKNLVRQWHHDVIDFFRELLDVDVFRSFGRVGADSGRPATRATVSLQILANGIIGSFDC